MFHWILDYKNVNAPMQTLINTKYIETIRKVPQQNNEFTYLIKTHTGDAFIIGQSDMEDLTAVLQAIEQPTSATIKTESLSAPLKAAKKTTKK